MDSISSGIIRDKLVSNIPTTQVSGVWKHSSGTLVVGNFTPASFSKLADNGTAALPGIAFTNAPNSGLSLTSSTAGSRGVRISTDGGAALTLDGSGNNRAATFAGAVTAPGVTVSGSLVVGGIALYTILVVTTQIVIPTSTPASASATGSAGTICWDANYIYICTAVNTWKRAALSSW